ncbi:hypothetical protein [Flavobacterium cerinum]|uniref:Uncharacterized protein n=1 Tax=Flavobacterium cerinum TaxID=2502784 RepID=A0A3S3U017_9FLAO|nr:hypothetical protein [Flavobacterium cerinum]RWW99989.1 hypothetical protein EPI11_10620 [Flavobacterium cerinum]
MWEPISLEELYFEIQKTVPELKDELLIFWEQIKIEPEKWQELLYGNDGGGFWVVAIFGEKVIWYNDIEEGFNISDYDTPNYILEYGTEQDELKWCLNKLMKLNK